MIDVQYASLTSQGVQHRVFYLDGHPSRYQPRPTGLNFGEQTGTGVFPLVIAVPLNTVIAVPLILVLYLKPKDFFLGENELCWICRDFIPRNNSYKFSLASRRALGDEMLCHLKLLHHYLWYSTVAYVSSAVSIYYCLSLGCLRKKTREESRGHHIICVFCV